MTQTPSTAASTAADQGRRVAGVAQGEAAHVAGEAKEQVRSVASETAQQVSGQVGEQSRQQKDKLVGTLDTASDDLHRMADSSEGGLAADVAREVAGHARSLSDYLGSREPGELLDDVRDLARRRPGVFLLGALAAGVVAGRVARGVKDAGSSGPATTSGGQHAAEGSGTAPAPMYGAPPPSTPPLPTSPPPVTPATTSQVPPGTEAPPSIPLPGQPT
ncbi:hypothetical protein [Nocardioides litoris]|uniref:hypothetical protein n=1 Tax=Nocardioides litoris TaxID=1926648 RepID=UPI0011232AFA|nr:hypothetical protein [Nocardioides litoris]